MSEGSAELKVLTDISEEIKAETRNDRRQRLIREFYEHAYESGIADPDQIVAIIEQELLDNYLQYPSLLNACNGNEEKAATHVRDYMLLCESLGEEIGHRKAIMDVERKAADFIFRPLGWKPDR